MSDQSRVAYQSFDFKFLKLGLLSQKSYYRIGVNSVRRQHVVNIIDS